MQSPGSGGKREALGHAGGSEGAWLAAKGRMPAGGERGRWRVCRRLRASKGRTVQWQLGVRESRSPKTEKQHEGKDLQDLQVWVNAPMKRSFHNVKQGGLLFVLWVVKLCYHPSGLGFFLQSPMSHHFANGVSWDHKGSSADLQEGALLASAETVPAVATLVHNRDSVLPAL